MTGDPMFSTPQVREISPEGGPSGFSGLDEESEIWNRAAEDDVMNLLTG